MPGLSSRMGLLGREKEDDAGHAGMSSDTKAGKSAAAALWGAAIGMLGGLIGLGGCRVPLAGLVERVSLFAAAGRHPQQSNEPGRRRGGASVQNAQRPCGRADVALDDSRQPLGR